MTEKRKTHIKFSDLEKQYDKMKSKYEGYISVQDVTNIVEKSGMPEDIVEATIEDQERTAKSKADLLELLAKNRPKEIDSVEQVTANEIDEEFFQKRFMDINTLSAGKKKILIIADVKGWAWWNKSRYIQYYLSDEFAIDVICSHGAEATDVDVNKYDCYLTYGVNYRHLLKGVPADRQICGMTAHRKKSVTKQLNGVSHLHANSKMLMSELTNSIRKSKFYYLPNGVDSELFVPVKPIGDEKRLRAGHVGKICDAKGQVDIILPAIEKANCVRHNNFSDYTNRIPYCKMTDFYQDLDVFLVASTEDGTPNGALEAASCGRPIISNHIGNMPEFIRDGYNGFLVDPEPEAYAERLKYLSDHRDILKTMGRNARIVVDRWWTWRRQAENYREMFRSIIK